MGAASHVVIGKISSAGSAFRIELDSVAGRPFHTGVRPTLYSTAKVCPGGYLVATAYPEKGKCKLEPVRGMNDDASLSSASNASSFDDASIALAQFQCYSPSEIVVDAGVDGIITCIQLIVENPVKPLQAGKKPAKARSKNDNGSHFYGADYTHVHLFIGTSSGTFIACDALRGRVLALARFVDSPNHNDVGSLADGLKRRSPAKESLPPLSAAPFQAESIVAFVESRPTSLLHHNPRLDHEAGGDVLAPSIEGVYVVHHSGFVVCLDREALETFVHVAQQLADDTKSKKDIATKFSLSEWRIDDATCAIPSVGPAAKFANTIKDIYDAEDLMISASFTGKVDESELKEMMKRKVWDAALIEYNTSGNPDAIRKGKSESLPALILCGEQPSFAFHLVSHRDSSFGAKVVTYATRYMKNLFFYVHTAPTVVPLERKILGLQRHFLDANIIISRISVDPTQQWGVFQAEQTGRLYVAELTNGSIQNVIKGRKKIQFQWHSTTVSRRRRLFLIVVQPERELMEIYDLQHQHCISTSTIPADALLLPPPSCTDGSQYTEVLWLNPSGMVYRITLDTSAFLQEVTHEQELAVSIQDMMGSISPADKSFKSFSTPVTRRNHLDNCTFTELLVTCQHPDDYYDCATNIPLPAYSNVAKADGEQLFSVYSQRMHEEFMQYEKLVNQMCGWIEWQYAPGNAESRRIPFTGSADPHYMPTLLTAGQTLNWLQHHLLLVKSYHALIIPPFVNNEVTLETLSGAPHFTRTALPTISLVYSSVEQWISSHLVDEFVIPVTNFVNSTDGAAVSVGAGEGGSAPLRRRSGTVGFWRRWFTIMSQQIPPAAGEAMSDGDVLCQRLFPYLFESEEEVEGGDVANGEPASSSQLAIMDLMEFKKYFYCGDDHLLFLRQRIKRNEADNQELDVYAQLGNVVFGQFGLSVLPLQLQTLATLGLGMRDIAMLCVAWVVHSCREMGARAFFQVSRMGGFFFVFSALSADALLQAVEAVPMDLVGNEKTYVTKTRHAVEALLLICMVRCIMIEKKKKKASLQFIRTRNAQNEKANHPFFMCLRRFLRLWELLTDHSDQLIVQVPNSPAPPVCSPLYLSQLHQSIPFSGAASATTVEEYILECTGMDFSRIHRIHSCIAKRDATDTDSNESADVVCEFNYLQLTELLYRAGVPALFALSRKKGLRGQQAVAMETGASPPCFPWFQNGVWNTDLFDAHVRTPLRELWQVLAKREQSSLASKFDQCCFFVGLLSVVEEVVKPFHQRLSEFWDDCRLPDRDFLSVVPHTQKGRENNGDPVLLFSGSRAMDDYFSTLANLFLFVFEVHRYIGLDSEDAQLSLSKAISIFIANNDQQVFTSVTSGLRDRLCILLSLVGESSRKSIRSIAEHLMGVVNMIQFFLHSAQLTVDGTPLALERVRIPWSSVFGQVNELHFLYPVSMGAISESHLQFIESQKNKQNVVAQILRSFLVSAIIGEQNIPRVNPSKGSLIAHMTDDTLTRIQSPDTYRVLTQLGSLLGMNEHITTIIVLDFHLKHMVDIAYIEKQLAQERHNSACIRLLTCHLQVFLRVAYEHLMHGVELSGDSRRMNLSKSKKRLSLSPSFQNWLKLSPESNVNVEAMSAAAAAMQSTAEGCDTEVSQAKVKTLLEEGINWFTAEEIEAYTARLHKVISSNDSTEIERMKNVLLHIVEFTFSSDPKNLGPVRDLSVDIQSVTHFIITAI